MNVRFTGTSSQRHVVPHHRSAGAIHRSAGAFGGDEAVEAVFLTSSGRTISVKAYRGLAYAIYPESWGDVTGVAFTRLTDRNCPRLISVIPTLD